jgi:hypothetical protein
LLFCPASLAQETDAWIGCWSHTYDAAQLAKHPGQAVTAMTLAISANTASSSDSDESDTSDSGSSTYRARITAKLRDKPATYATLDSALCALAGQDKDHLACAGSGIFLDAFSLEPAAKNMKLTMKGSDQHMALTPGIDIGAFYLLSPDNPEHALFVLQPAPAKVCGL